MPTRPSVTAAVPTVPSTTLPTVTPVSPGFSCEEQPDSHCRHPINDILVPLLRASGTEPRDASPAELCRRLAVDVLGRIPSESELDDCVAQPIEATLDTWMDTEDYEKVQLRFWSSELGYDAFTTIWGQVFDLDELVARMVRGEITYDEFAVQAITHPAFVPTTGGELAFSRRF